MTDFGTGVVPLLPPHVRRARLLEWQAIDVVIDVGANTGQYGRGLRACGYEGAIVSFEPLTDAFSQLAATASNDPRWTCHQLALGAEQGTAVLNVSRDLEASSLLPMEDRHLRHWPPSEYVGTELVEVRTLDSLLPSLELKGRRVHLKVDVPGYELEVLSGTRAAFPTIQTIDAELSLVPLYTGGPLFLDVVRHLLARDFGLISVEGITEEPESGHMLQVDGIFARRS